VERVDKIRNFFNNRIVKTVLKVLSWIVLIFLILLATILIYYVVSSKIYEAKGKKYEPLISLYTIISPSMEPNINVYDVVITRRVKPEEVKEGDVITFISSSTLGEGLTITHRVKSVIKTEGDIKFRTQGDNNPIPDSALVTSNNLLGKVVFIIPFLGYIQFMLQSKSGWLFFLLIPAIIVVIYDVVKVIKLSNVKQRLNETLKEEEKDEVLVEKQEKLKEELKEKFAGFENFSPEVQTEEPNEEKYVESKPVEPAIQKFNNNLINLDNITEEDNEIVLPKMKGE
jgi:signal peptidase